MGKSFKHFLTCLILCLGSLPLFAQNCNQVFDLSQMPGGYFDGCDYVLQYPEPLHLRLSDLEMQFMPGKSYELLVWLKETRFSKSNLSLTLSGPLQVDYIVQSKTFNAGAYRFEFQYVPQVSHLNWIFEQSGSGPASAQIKMGYLEIREKNCPMELLPNSPGAEPSLWLMAGASTYRQNPDEMLKHTDLLKNWQSFGRKNLIAQQLNSPSQPIYHNRGAATINGHPVLRFDGLDDLLSLDFQKATPQKDFSVFVVFRTEDEYGNILGEASSPDFYATDFQSQTGTRFGRFSHRMSTPTWETYAQSFDEVNDGEVYIGMVDVPVQGSRSVRLNGYFVGAHVVNEHFDALNYLLIGGHASYGSFKGDIAEIILFEHAIEDEKRQQIETYLSVKYGTPLPYQSYRNSFGDSLAVDLSYDENLAVLARMDQPMLDQRTAKSGNEEGPRIEIQTDCLEDQQFVFLGDEGSKMELSADLDIGTNNRLARSWHLYQTGDMPIGVDLVLKDFPEGLNSLILHPSDPALPFDDQIQSLVLEPLENGDYYIHLDLEESLYFSLSDEISPLFELQLEDFSGRANNRSVELVWITRKERYTKEFIIERSEDGLAFQPIANISAQGHSDVVQVYEYTDDYVGILSPGNKFYRLKIVDQSGFFVYSDMRYFELPNALYLEVNPYPNPTYGHLNLEIIASEKHPLQIRLMDIHGNLIWEERLQSGPQVLLQELDLAEYAEGLYFLEISSESLKEIRKILLQKP